MSFHAVSDPVKGDLPGWLTISVLGTKAVGSLCIVSNLLAIDTDI